ncbi:MAG: hypothetical protein O0X93_06425 [Methanocorpusculum sp.]|nr:hypothetical protein [Methanocorpusculum sp.]MDE2524280.1 hypothetical protein [Methanocorpusculum sp.]
MSRSSSAAENLSIRDPETGSLEVFSDRFFVGVKIYEAGEFTNEDTKEVIQFDKGIKLISVSPKGERSMKLTALQAIFLLSAMQHPEILAELRARAKDERAEMDKDLAAMDAIMG